MKKTFWMSVYFVYSIVYGIGEAAKAHLAYNPVPLLKLYRTVDGKYFIAR